ncbi:hypothetical protein FVA74_04325 [Salinibacterium sp. dk2585]|uniref:DUF5671 domain-containing protein n=1 Tax=unclassified Salinibacterium TaxID=2632331 RepID=UPI0011C24B3A|nr:MULTISPECIES: DUF5671 domain-containing protein [unclassified Salinibacterium]QEE60891.1 hypothetical protein FVA74_04325 [Salinibacterium sp. dk2585]TXK55962.1 hypothetical protein FVP63_04470 [Salinibacterium sp. dk5596]
MSLAAQERAPGGIHTLRRVIMYALLAILVSVAASGVTGLLHLALETGTVLDDAGSRLAQSVASVIVAVPLGAVVYWLTRRWLSTFDDRRSVLWPVYLAVFGTIALSIGLFALVSAASEGIAGRWSPSSLTLGVVWTSIWAWHAWMWQSPSHAPGRLHDVAPALGVLVGIGVAIAGGIGVLSVLFSTALVSPESALVGADRWWIPLLQQLTWALAGGLVWWWHWHWRGVDRSGAPFARFVLVVIAGLIAVGVTLGALASATYSGTALVLHLDSVSILLDQLAASLAAASIGALVWAAHRTPVRRQPEGVGWSVRLVASGVALIAAASGLGVVVNALLASTVDTVAGDSRSLLFGGLSTLAVGAVAWITLWRPQDAIPAEPGDGWNSFGGRRAYLVVIFGASAVTAVVTLLVIAYGVLESILGVPWSGGVVESIRAPLGLLTATALVAIYHYLVWRRTPAAPSTARRHPVTRVTLVASGVTDALVATLREQQGADVSVWPTRDARAAPDASVILRALQDETASHVLVIARADGIETIALAE